MSSSASSNLCNAKQNVATLCLLGDYSQAFKRLFPGASAPLNEVVLENFASLPFTLLKQSYDHL